MTYYLFSNCSILADSSCTALTNIGINADSFIPFVTSPFFSSSPFLFFILSSDIVINEGNTSSKKSGSQRNGGEVCKQLRAYKKNKAGVMISIVGFGRPKFGSAPAGTAKKPASKPKTCSACGQNIK